MKAKINNVTINIVLGEVPAQKVAAIVNATDTNPMLPPILAAIAGDQVIAELNQIGWCDVGSAVITSAGGLSFQKLIHTVGPRWGEGAERGKLANATWHCLHLAEQHRLRSIAMPAISTGKNGYPLENCAMTMLSQIIDYTFEDLKYLKTILICLDNPTALDAFEAELAQQLQDLKSSGADTMRV